MDGFENAFALLLDGSGGARSLTLEETRNWRASEGMRWVHLPPDLPRVLEAVFHLPPRVREPLLADTGRVRIDVLNENELVLLLLNPDSAPTNVSSPRQLRAWMTADRCVTVAPTNQPAIVAVREQLAHGRGPRGTDLFLAFASTALSMAALRTTELDDTLSGLETRVTAGTVPRQRTSPCDSRSVATSSTSSPASSPGAAQAGGGLDGGSPNALLAAWTHGGPVPRRFPLRQTSPPHGRPGSAGPPLAPSTPRCGVTPAFPTSCLGLHRTGGDLDATHVEGPGLPAVGAGAAGRHPPPGTGGGSAAVLE
ncbi:hypothetical protein D7X99_40720 [Corallococcus sp. AB032C]|uniref:CorA family divalent cation transporter n=1 Tax=Corallococcus TaxID=83461 RepID=UPI000EC3B019|nr:MULTISPECIES: CorA family divalent cation transporter [Corallococcus]NNB91566.1 hypothetical protein [Corallococcus exiguus]NPC52560.1 hypothetical protein [Corallococcus exiguus]RKH74423.1 hypothetical protein D7X99_40720 [Corallococcus sp. AB032C]